MCKSDKDKVDNIAVSEMNIRFRTCIKINVILYRYAFSFMIFFELRFSAVYESETILYQVDGDKINVGHYRLYQHGLNNLTSDHVIPIDGEITILIFERKEA